MTTENELFTSDEMLDAKAKLRSKVNLAALGAVSAAITMMGCAAKPTVETRQSTRDALTHAKSHAKQTETSTTNQAPLSRLDKIVEQSVFRSLQVFSHDIVGARGKKELLHSESKLEYSDKDQLQREKKDLQVLLEVSAYKAFKEVMKADPRCWPRLLRSLIEMTKKDPVILQSMKESGEYEKTVDSPTVKNFQMVMYKEIIQLLASLIARLDIDISKCDQFLQEPLSSEERGQIETAKDNFFRQREQLMKPLGKGTLFPAYPAPPTECEGNLLELFEKTRFDKGGLPPGNSIKLRKIQFGLPTPAPVPSNTTDSDDREDEKPRKRSSRNVRVAAVNQKNRETIDQKSA